MHAGFCVGSVFAVTASPKKSLEFISLAIRTILAPDQKFILTSNGILVKKPFVAKVTQFIAQRECLEPVFGGAQNESGRVSFYK